MIIHIRMLGLMAVLAFAVGLGLASSARADDMKLCLQGVEQGTVTGAEVAACTRIIDNHRSTAVMRGAAYVNRCAHYQRQNLLAQALGDCNAALALNPRNYAAYQNRGDVYNIQKQWDLAIADFNSAIALHPVWPSYTDRGWAWLNKGNADQAIADYNKAIELGPNAGAAYARRGFYYSDRQLWDLAIADFSDAIRYGRDTGDVRLARGISYKNKGMRQEAYADFLFAVLLGNKQSAYFQLGLMDEEAGNSDSAIVDFSGCIDQPPGNADRCYNERGNVYRSQQKYAEAIADYTKSISLYANNADVYYWRSMAYEGLSDYHSEMVDSMKVIELAPNFWGGYNAMAWTLYKQGSGAAGIGFVQKALLLNPGNAASLDTRAHIEAVMGDKEKAIADYKAALAIDPTLKESQEGLAELQKPAPELPAPTATPPKTDAAPAPTAPAYAPEQPKVPVPQAAPAPAEPAPTN